MVKDSGKERRKFSRIDKNFRLEYKLMDLSKAESFFVKSKVKNISANGLLLESEKQYDIGDLIQLKVYIMGIEKEKTGFFKYDQTAISEPMTILARVVRIEEIKKNKLYDIGVEFKNIYEDDSDALVTYINKNILKS